MSFREVTMLEVKEVLRQWLLGIAKKAIARQLGLDVKTVRSYIDGAKERGLSLDIGQAGLTDELLAGVVASKGAASLGRPRGQTWAVCDSHREVITTFLPRGVRLSKVRRLLARRGVDVPYSALYRYATAELGFGRAAATVPIADCDPGQEIQVDVGVMGSLEADSSGRRRRLLAWIFTPVLSRYRFVYPVFNETTETAIEACEAAWDFYQGVFK